jgi:hypothetical protein
MSVTRWDPIECPDTTPKGDEEESSMKIRRLYDLTHPRSLFAALLLGIGLVAAAPAAATTAQGDDIATVTVVVRLCVEPGCTELLEMTEPVDGLAVEVSDAATGTVLGSCVTGSAGPGACTVEMPWTVEVLLAFDPAAIPAGYAPLSNPEAYRFGAEPMPAAEAAVLFYPTEGFPPEEAPDDSGVAPTPPADTGDETPPVVALPETGTGGARDTYAPLAGGAMLAAVVLAIVAGALRRGAMSSGQH